MAMVHAYNSVGYVYLLFVASYAGEICYSLLSVHYNRVPIAAREEIVIIQDLSVIIFLPATYSIHCCHKA